MWVLFTAHQDDSNKVKMIERFCVSQSQANMVAKAFLNKLEGKGYSFVSQEFCHYNVVADYSEIKHDSESMTSYIVANPCSYGRWNDIGCEGLHQYL